MCSYKITVWFTTSPPIGNRLLQFFLQYYWAVFTPLFLSSLMIMEPHVQVDLSKALQKIIYAVTQTFFIISQLLYAVACAAVSDSFSIVDIWNLCFYFWIWRLVTFSVRWLVWISKRHTISFWKGPKLNRASYFKELLQINFFVVFKRVVLFFNSWFISGGSYFSKFNIQWNPALRMPT